MAQRSGRRLSPLGPLVVATVVMLGCGKATEQTPDHAISAVVSVKPSAPVTGSTSRIIPSVESDWPSSEDRERQTDAVLAWYQTVRDDPDPTVRLRVIETWTQQQAPDDRLDVLTYALVDPDESVRARAQDWLEEQLARR